jgi:hypothetical protein
MVADTTPPDTVTVDSATGGIQYVIVEWTHNTEPDLASYNIYRNTTDNSATATLIGNIRTNYFIDGGLTGGTEYFYWVKALDTSGNVSAAFSTVKSATPRNVGSDDIVTIAGSKVLIDGTVYLSNWRNSTDLTKIDGGNIYTGTVTTTQLNFTPVQSTDVIAKINASAEGIRIEADNITISGSTTLLSGTIEGGSDTGARVKFFPDATTGLQIIDDADADVFKVTIGGTNVGDVVIGNYSGGQGIFYDKSAGTTIFKGAISAGTITIGSNAWHVDSSGNMWWGSSSTYAGATYKISAAGVANLSGIVAASVAAENITAGTITGSTVQSSSGAGRVALSSGNTLDFYNSSNSREGYIYTSGNDLTYVSADDHFFQGTVKPNANNTYRCGSSGAIWSRVYADVYYAGSTETAGKSDSDSFLSAIDDEVSGGYVTNVKYKTRTINFTGGIFTDFGTETDWIDA